MVKRRFPPPPIGPPTVSQTAAAPDYLADAVDAKTARREYARAAKAAYTGPDPTITLTIPEAKAILGLLVIRDKITDPNVQSALRKLLW